MKGILFTARGVAELTDEPEPRCGSDQVLLKTLYSGLSNGTERSFLCGGAYGGDKWPNRIGYLSVSAVVQTGEHITRFAAGDVVYTGTFSGHVALHTASASDLIVKVPQTLDPKAATMLGIAGVSYFNAARLGIGADDRVLVTGSGGIGLMAVQAAKAMGAQVTLASRTARRRALGKRLGADAVKDPDAKAFAQSGPYSAWLECGGGDLAPFLDPAQDLLARFVRIALVAGRRRVDYNFLWASRLRAAFHQSTHFDQATLETVTRLAADGTLDLGALIKEVVPVDEAIRVYDTLRDDPLSLGGTVFDWTARPARPDHAGAAPTSAPPMQRAGGSG